MTVKETETATRRETPPGVSSAVLCASARRVPGPPCSFYSCASVSSREEANPRPLYTGYLLPPSVAVFFSHGWQLVCSSLEWLHLNSSPTNLDTRPSYPHLTPQHLLRVLHAHCLWIMCVCFLPSLSLSLH